LERLLATVGTESAMAIDERLIEDVERFSRGAGQADDITVLTLRVQ